MRVAIHTLGTRGDVQPYLALALGLMARGHSVSLAAPAQFEDFVKAHGVEVAPLSREFLDLMDDPDAKAAMAGSKGGFKTGFKLIKRVKPMMLRLFDDEWAAARDFAPDLMVFHPKALAAPAIAEKLGVPAVLASPLPGFTPTAAFPSPMLPAGMPAFMNRMSHNLMVSASTALWGKALRKWGEEALGLSRRARLPAWRDLPTLYAYSPSVLPSPPDWGPNIVVSGYWFLDEAGEWAPSPQLQAFLDAGPPPIYVGFGSMPSADPDALTRTVVEAASRAAQRVVLAAGWARLGGVDLPANLHLIDSAPHQQLFPLMSAIVHHGGAGTTAAALRAGKPNLICPLFGDQPFWGRLVHRLGAGPPPILLNGLTAEGLAGAFVELGSRAEMRARAEALGAAIRSENGVATAIDFLEAIHRRGRVSG